MPPSLFPRSIGFNLTYQHSHSYDSQRLEEFEQGNKASNRTAVIAKARDIVQALRR